MPFTDNVVYQAPQIRLESLTEIEQRLEVTRSARMVQALSHRDALVVKYNKEGEKDVVRFSKLQTRILKRLERMQAEFDKAEKELIKLNEYHSNLILLEEGIS